MPPIDEPLTAEETAITSAPAPEPAASPEPTPAPAEPVAAEPVANEPAAPAPAEPAAQPTHMVPYGELKSEREARQKLEREMAKMQGRFEEWVRTTGTPKPAEPAPTPAPAMPDPEANPIEALKYVQGQLAREQEARAAQEKQAKDQRAQQEHAQELNLRYVAAARDFSREAPDFNDAYQHFVGMREQAMIAAGYTDPVQRQSMLNQQEADIVRNALGRGENPAALIYATAKAFGYNRPEPAAAAPSPAPAAVSLSPAAPAPAPAPQLSEAQKLDALKAGVDRGSKTIAGAGGGAVAPKMDLRTFARMSDDEFGRAVSDDDFRKVMKQFYSQPAA